ncbi:Retrotransposon gag protein [Arachis hypogaea]|nr:Retrotransposon gag protein [Arachis hypogaea]
MHRNRDKEPFLDFDPEPEKTFRRRLQQERLNKAAESTMDPNNAVNANVANLNGDDQQRRVIGSYSAPTADIYGKSIVVPLIAANNFELKPQLVTLVQQNCQCHGLPHEDPNQFISNFLQICDTVKTNGVNPEVYKHMLFPFSLRDGAKLWLDSQPKESLDTWDKVVTEFLTKFFPPKKLTKRWRFRPSSRRMVKLFMKLGRGGLLHKKKTPEETIELIELVASNQYLYSSNRNHVNSEAPQKKGVMEVEALNVILAQNKLMSQQINLLTQQMGGMQISAINTQNPPHEVSYDMTGNFVQNDNYDYAQSSSEQETRTSIKNLEIQMGQIATRVNEIDQRTTNSLPGNTIPNPREECKAIILISGQVAAGSKTKVNEELVEKEAIEEKKEEVEHVPPKRADNPFPDSLDTYTTLPKAPEYKPKMPYPQRLQKETKDKQFSKFLEVFRKFQINIPFAEVLEQIPLYVKFMKELLSKKKPLRGDETVVQTKECSVIIQNNLPKKMPDPGSFQIPCTIGSTTFEKALCDMGASINLMPLSVMKKLQIQETQPTKIALQMADKSMKPAYGLVENILVKVGKFFLPADFVILDTGEDENASIILGRPFLDTGRALIDVEVGELVLRVHNEQLVFHVFKDIHSAGREERCIQTELIDPNLQEPPDDVQQHLQLKPPLVTINKFPPNIKPKFGVGNASSTKEEVLKKKKVPRGWRNKKIPTEDFSPGMKVVLTRNLVWIYTVNKILSLEHIELIYGDTGKKFKVRGEELSPYDPPP